MLSWVQQKVRCCCTALSLCLMGSGFVPLCSFCLCRFVLWCHAHASRAQACSASEMSHKHLLLLGPAADPQQLLTPDQQLVPWWQLKAKQSSPPRQTLLNPPGELARFVTDQALYATKVRSGKSTKMGGELDIPQVSPAILAMYTTCIQCFSCCA